MATPKARAPEPNVEVYALGHYEQMVIAQMFTLTTTEDEAEYDTILANIDMTTLEALALIFASHGTVTITRTNPED